MADVVTYPYHLGVARQEVQDPVAEVGVFVLSLLMSFEGTMVLNEFSHGCSFCPGGRGLCGVQHSSVVLLGRYANWSGSRVSGIMVLM